MLPYHRIKEHTFKSHIKQNEYWSQLVGRSTAGFRTRRFGRIEAIRLILINTLGAKDDKRW